VILAAEECNPAEVIICSPDNVNELFVFPGIWGPINRTVVLIGLAAVIVVLLLWLAFRKPRLVPTKFQAAMESLVGLVRDDIAVGIIGPEGVRYAPYLLSLFLFILVGNLFEVTPFINFPITSRMAIPALLALATYFIYMFKGFAEHGFRFIGDVIWPPGIPVVMKPLIGIIELAQVLLLRPFTLAVRLFANLVAGHVMLSLLLVTGVVFVASIGDLGLRSLLGIPWFILGLGIFAFEIFVSVLQAYIFTMLSAVYIQMSIHPAH
jgi:F-type H+-transporting ATPase subunit a